MPMVTAVINASPASLEWLGPRSIVSWVLSAALEARGVDSVILVLPEGAPTAHLPTEDAGVTLVVTPQPISLAEVVATAKLPARTVLVDLHPGAVFLKPETIEKAVAAVVNDGKSSAVTVSRVPRAMERTGGSVRTVMNAVVEVPGCRVLTDASAVPEDTFGRGGFLVEVRDVEGIDATSSHGARVARALVESGIA